MTRPASANTFELVFDPGSASEGRMMFAISEADIEDAIDYGRVERDEPFDKQLSGAAYHMVLNQRVRDDDGIFERPWVVLRNGTIIARSHLAMGISEDDLV